LFQKILDSEPVAIILYTLIGEWCSVDWSRLRSDKVFTTISASDANSALGYIHEGGNNTSGVRLSISGNPSVTTARENGGGTEGGRAKTIVLIVLVAIWGGLITIGLAAAVFGVIRARRYPERYGPRRETEGQASQTKVGGITRAVLDALPIIKLGSQGSTLEAPGFELQTKQEEGGNGSSGGEAGPEATCNICTEPFATQDEARLLPCDHMFHPECVDPWILNGPATCPLWYVEFPLAL